MDNFALDEEGQDMCWYALLAEATNPRSSLSLMRSIIVRTDYHKDSHQQWQRLAYFAAGADNINAFRYIHEERGYFGFSLLLDRYILWEAERSNNAALVAYARTIDPHPLL
jgi:hypothetical protein